MEIWDLYDANKNLLGRTHVRGEELPDDGYHLVVHCWIRNSEGKYLISQRASHRPTYPLMFECVGGSVTAGEDSRQGALREIVEEVGLDLSVAKAEIVYTKTRGFISGKKFNDIMDVWLFDYTGEVDLSKATTDEVCDTKWCSIDEIKQIQAEGKLVPTLEYIYDIDKKVQNKQKIAQKNKKNKKKIKKLSESSKYFDFYDDVKAGCHKVIDW